MQGLRLGADTGGRRLAEELHRRSHIAVEEAKKVDIHHSSMEGVHCSRREGDHYTTAVVAATWMPRATTRNLDEL